MTLDLTFKAIGEILKKKENRLKIFADLYANYLRTRTTNAIVYWNFNPEEFENSQMEKSGFLSNVPVVVKDNILTKGIPTTAASRILLNYVPPYNATAVEKIIQAGAIIVGKSNLDEFGMGSRNQNSFFGPCKNPWNLEYVSGGSSGGSAVAVSCRICSFALGSDTGGSVRLPASYCGCYGLKPTYGKVSRFGLIAFGSSLDQIGVMATDIETCAKALEFISGFDRNDATTVQHEPYSFEEVINSPLPLKIGYLDLEEYSGSINPSIKRVYEYVIEFFETQGISVVPVKLKTIEYAIPCYYIICTAEAASNLSRYDGIRYGWNRSDTEKHDGCDLNEYYTRIRTEGFGEEVQRRIILGNFVLSAGYHGRYYQKALRLRTAIFREFESIFEECAALLLPTAPDLPPKIDDNRRDVIKDYLMDIFTVCANLCGYPALSFPAGFSDTGFPIGIQIYAKQFREDIIYRLAWLFESNHSFHKAVPPVLFQ
ncbi:MAG: Asp-tRNA(Asn)/Glu-tRNA(Gln) amidotransferase subunit GatA [Deltaproteobacteria bacterium]|nr:Asp-tRNA(Asn)/Glu-tRNA(Gln) amidotransferase subunit GatA [Deltaproteobacteria bacterium]